VEALERDAAALRKLIEATRDLGEARVAVILNGGGRWAGKGADYLNARDAAISAGAPIPATSDPPVGLPRGRQAVRIIVHERPGLWTLVDLRAEMKRRSWFTSNKGVDIAVTRMCGNGEARRVGKGRYEFFAPASEERDAA
jgi:hypothetical protein